MSKKIIIVESPSKSKTINSYVGKDYLVVSSKGHIRDLSTKGKDRLGLDFDNNLAPIYETIPAKKATVDYLKKVSEGNEVLIATDPDREGEAIGWHLAQVLGVDENKTNRIEFREITKKAILDALEHPKKLDMNLVHSQEVRRVLDRIIGFKLSKLLKSKINSQSAGRVQSVALKLIVDLEKEINQFVSEEYYDIKALFNKFDANYIVNDKRRIKKEEALKIVNESSNPFIVNNVIKKESKRKSKPPYITSTLQQDAINTLSMSSSRTMMVAQSLYEGKEINNEMVGLITYMRTDSIRLSNDFVYQTKKYIEDNFGKEYVGYYKENKNAASQDAHEAIRPTSIYRTPESIEKYLSKDEFRLYDRIYKRTIASLMSDAIYDTTEIVLNSNGHQFNVIGSILRFLGHQAVLPDKSKDVILPDIKIGDEINAKEVTMEQKFTQPKSRYTEATLIKELESLGIGRPSTYATIISTLKNRDYVINEKKKFYPTTQGIATTEALDKYFSSIINVDYTKKMEKTLDDIADGKNNNPDITLKFYNNFMPLINKAEENMEKAKPEQTDEICPKCGSPLVIRNGKYGKFVACSAFPKCKYVKK